MIGTFFNEKENVRHKQLCLVYTEKLRKKERETLQHGASPSQEDSFAPVSGKTLFGFHSYSKNGFVLREIPCWS